MLTPWLDAHDVRSHANGGDRRIEAVASAWIYAFQARLAGSGFRWVDASMRNLLVTARGSQPDAFRFAVVDYTVRPLTADSSFPNVIDYVTDLASGAVAWPERIAMPGFGNPVRNHGMPRLAR